MSEHPLQWTIDQIVLLNPDATSAELEAIFVARGGDLDTFRRLVRWPPGAPRQLPDSIEDDNAEPDNPQEVPDVRDRDLPYDYDGDGVAGYLPELRDRGVRHEDEDEDEAGL